MNYKLCFENESYPIEDIHILSKSAFVQESVGKPFSFVSPVRMRTGQSCVLRAGSDSYQILVNTCLGFTDIPRYLVSGMIAKAATASAS